MTHATQPTPHEHFDYQDLFEHAGVGLLEIGFDGRMRRVNPNCAEFLGYPREVLQNLNVLDITHPDDIPRTLEALQSVISGATRMAVLEKRYVRADSEVVWSRSRVALLPSAGGVPVSVVAVVADITELKRAQQDLEAMNAHLQATLEGGLLGLGIALEARDLETSGHTMRVMNLAQQLGAPLGLSPVTLNDLRHGASLHDLGKLTIPDAVLHKAGPLDAAEWTVMRAHALNGYAIAARIPALASAALDVIRNHHERWDGTGYPDRLAGQDIPLLARIFAVVDVYDALTHARPYKVAWSHAAALQEIARQGGRQFDPDIVETFVTMLGKVPPAGAAPS